MMKARQRDKVLSTFSLGRTRNSVQSGFTLIELVVVLGIVGILMVAMGFEFIGWRGKYNAEADIKKLYGDLSNARSKAIQTKTIYYMGIQLSDQIAEEPKKYHFYADNDPDSMGVLDFSNDEEVEFQNNPDLSNNLKTSGDLSKGATIIGFTRSGQAFDAASFEVITTPMWIRVVDTEIDPETTEPYDLYADIDCLEIVSTRINLGQYDEALDKCVTK